MPDELLQKLKIIAKELPKRAATLVAEYSGSGDSGDFDGIHVANAKGRKLKIDAKLETRLYDLFGELLYSRHPGWENNDGASGTFTLDIAAGMLTHDHNDYFIDSTNTCDRIEL